MLWNNGREVIDVNGWLVEKDVLGIIDRVQAYDPNLVVLYLDPNKADFNDAPWIVAERCPDGQLRRVFECWELNETVYERVVRADTNRTDILASIDQHNQRMKENQQRRFLEERAAARDVLEHLVKTPKTRYSFPNAENQTVVIDDSIGVVKKDGRNTI